MRDFRDDGSPALGCIVTLVVGVLFWAIVAGIVYIATH
jgi:hypothetical protein